MHISSQMWSLCCVQVQLLTEWRLQPFVFISVSQGQTGYIMPSSSVLNPGELLLSILLPNCPRHRFTQETMVETFNSPSIWPSPGIMCEHVKVHTCSAYSTHTSANTYISVLYYMNTCKNRDNITVQEARQTQKEQKCKAYQTTKLYLGEIKCIRK